jgi:hypothetical protein
MGFFLLDNAEMGDGSAFDFPERSSFSLLFFTHGAALHKYEYHAQHNKQLLLLFGAWG